MSPFLLFSVNLYFANSEEHHFTWLTTKCDVTLAVNAKL